MTGAFLFVSLIASIVYIVVMFILSPAGITSSETPDHVKGDYALMLLPVYRTCGYDVPSVMEMSIAIPNFMYVLYFIFLYYVSTWERFVAFITQYPIGISYCMPSGACWEHWIHRRILITPKGLTYISPFAVLPLLRSDHRCCLGDL